MEFTKISMPKSLIFFLKKKRKNSGIFEILKGFNGLVKLKKKIEKMIHLIDIF